MALAGSILHVALGKAQSDRQRKPSRCTAIGNFRSRPSRGPHYKAAPRDGVWATPPFMHNGSVPNLYEMLIPASATHQEVLPRAESSIRSRSEWTPAANPDSFLVDTSLVGNSNSGHSFENGPRGNGVIGPLLTDEQRWAIVEYLKSIPEEAGRVTPFGGPPNAVTGHAKWAEQPKEP